MSDIFNVTIDELIRNDDKLREKINVGENDSTFNDPDFYLGATITIIGILTDFGFVSTIFMFLGLAIIIFYKDSLTLLKQLIKDFKKTIKG